MNKAELISAVANKSELTKADSEKVVAAFISAVSETLKAKESLTLVGFGTFKVTHRKAKTGVNPKTGEKIQIAAKDVPVFKPGKALKELVR